jgi:hypothetical protein
MSHITYRIGVVDISDIPGPGQCAVAAAASSTARTRTRDQGSCVIQLATHMCACACAAKLRRRRSAERRSRTTPNLPLAERRAQPLSHAADNRNRQYPDNTPCAVRGVCMCMGAHLGALWGSSGLLDAALIEERGRCLSSATDLKRLHLLVHPVNNSRPG